MFPPLTEWGKGKEEERLGEERRGVKILGEGRCGEEVDSRESSREIIPSHRSRGRKVRGRGAIAEACSLLKGFVMGFSF